jgi:uncharacterized protein YuzE
MDLLKRLRREVRNPYRGKIRRATYDREAKALYIYFSEGVVARTEEDYYHHDMFRDWTADEDLIGLEILNVELEDITNGRHRDRDKSNNS